jgi:exonuclease VII large subunit
MAKGKIVRSSKDVHEGDVVETYLQDGMIQSVVE